MRFSVVLVLIGMFIIGGLLYVGSRKPATNSKQISTDTALFSKRGKSEAALLPTRTGTDAIIETQVANSPVALLPPPAPLKFPERSVQRLISTDNVQVELEREKDLSKLTFKELGSAARDWQAPQVDRENALYALLGRIQSHPDQSEARAMLIDLKDKVIGEERHAVLKALISFADQGGNEAIIESFMLTGQEVPADERGRMLSYVNSSNPLSTDTVARLSNFYLNEADQELRRSLLEVLVASGGEQGTTWIIENADAPVGTDEWFMRVDALSRSNSQQAYQHLHELMNELAATEPGESKERRVLHDAIQQLKSGLEQQPN